MTVPVTVRVTVVARALCMALVPSLLCTACIDFGVEIGEGSLEDAGVEDPTDGGAVDAGDVECVEGEESEPSANGVTINIVTLGVDLPVAQLPAGETLTFVNTNSERHTMVSGAPGAEIPPAQGGFATPPLAQGQRYTHRFCDPRTIIYFCREHPGQMNNYRLIVE